MWHLSNWKLKRGIIWFCSLLIVFEIVNACQMRLWMMQSVHIHRFYYNTLDLFVKTDRHTLHTHKLTKGRASSRLCVCAWNIFSSNNLSRWVYSAYKMCKRARKKALSHTLTHRLHRCTHKSECVHTKTFWVTKKINKNVKRDKNGNCVYVINVYLYFYTLIRSLAHSYNLMLCDVMAMRPIII